MQQKSLTEFKYFAVTTIVASVFLCPNAGAFTSSQLASVEIIERPASMQPIDNKQIFLEKTVNLSHQNSEEAIEAEYLMNVAGGNNVQVRLTGNETNNSQIKFKSMQALAKSDGAKAASIKLSTIVTVPADANSGKHRLSLQLSALYE